MKFVELTYAFSGMKGLFRTDTIELVVEGRNDKSEIYINGTRTIVEESFHTVKKLLEGAEA